VRLLSRLAGLAAVLSIAALPGVAVSATRSSPVAPAPTAKCAHSATPAVIAGKRTCLVVGQRCKKGLDKQYHRYKFHCHTGRLTRSKPSPPPPAGPPPLPGRRIDVGGYSLYIECTGSGSPTVIFEAGEGGAAASNPLPAARGVRASVSNDTRVCAYDRAGLGASDRRSSSRPATGKQYANELHALLTGANELGPYVLVGPSFGGLVIMSYALYYPAETAGLVFVDSENACTCAFPDIEPSEFDLASVTFGARPIVVLRAVLTDGPDLARRSTNSILVNADSGHIVFEERPQLVVEATRVVVAAARSGGKLPPCDQTGLPAAGGKCE
jgi:hypothetical protein